MKTAKKLISIVSPCFNEEGNIAELYDRIKNSINECPQYDYEIIFIDNSSTDLTVEKIKNIAERDKSVKLIVNNRNFGHIRSPYYGILQSNGVATVYLASDLQDPPEMIPTFIKEWEGGHKLVMAVKPNSEGSVLMHFLRRQYYALLDKISDVQIIKDSTGFGLYDKEIISLLKEVNDPYPFLRGLICEFGFEVKTIPFVQPKRMRGLTKNNIYTLYDIAMLGIVSHSKVPLRIAALVGIVLSFTSFFVAITYSIMKLFNWNSFPIGIAPIVIGLFFLLGVQLIMIAIVGEYVASIHVRLQNRPVVVEKERINFGQ